MVLKLSSRSPAAPRQASTRRRFPWALLWLSPLLAIALLWAYKEMLSTLAQPKVALVLGGLEQREHFAAQLARRDRELEVWVSSGSPESYARSLFDAAGIEPRRVHLDYQAQDTVTNFTSLADTFESQGVESVYLITSANHMPRARVVGEIIFGSRGITIKPLAVPSGGESEPVEKVLRDGLRALLWLLTGSTGAELSDRAPGL